MTPGATRKAERRQAHQPDTGSQYKDKSPSVPADQREGSPAGAGATASGIVRLVDRGTPNRGVRAVVRSHPRAVVPKHVEHCTNAQADWFIYTWHHGAPKKVTRTPYHCNSWRCFRTVTRNGEKVEIGCARHEASVTFARIKEAFAPLDPSGFVFSVLTLDRDGFYSDKPWRDVNEAYRALGSMSEKLLKRLRRFCLARGWFARDPDGNILYKTRKTKKGIKLEPLPEVTSSWVAVVEAHRSGWPHVNFVIHAPELAKFLESERARRELEGATQREQRLAGGELLALLLDCGWGPQSTFERARDRNALASYVTKLAGLQDASTGELAKITQAPLVAPERFRRLRSGKGFLPPRRSNPDVTGTMVRRTHLNGHVHVEPLHDVGKRAEREGNPELAAEQREQVAACCYIEQDLTIQEREREAWNHLAKSDWKDAELKTPLVSTFLLGRPQECDAPWPTTAELERERAGPGTRKATQSPESSASRKASSDGSE